MTTTKPSAPPAAYVVTVIRTDTGAPVSHGVCPSLDAALCAKSRLFKTHHALDPSGADIPVPHAVAVDNWDEVDRLRLGSLGPFFPVHVTIRCATGAELSDLGKHKRSGVAVPAPRPAPAPTPSPTPKPVPVGVGM
jgi:hypothetical protein